jgi:hypothetical protein
MLHRVILPLRRGDMKRFLIVWIVGILGLAAGAAVAQEEVSADEVLRVLKEARNIASQQVLAEGRTRGLVPISLSELAEKLQVGSSSGDLTPWSDSWFARVFFSDRCLTAYNMTLRSPAQASEIVPLISFPEEILDRVWVQAFSRLPEGHGIISIEMVAEQAGLSPALTEAVCRSRDFEQRKTVARSEGRVFPLIFPVTEHQLSEIIRKVAAFARISEDDVRANRDSDPRIEEVFRTLLKIRPLETDLERVERQRVHVVTRAALRNSQAADVVVKVFDETTEAIRAAQGEGLVPLERRSEAVSRSARIRGEFIERVVRRFRRGLR